MRRKFDLGIIGLRRGWQGVRGTVGAVDGEGSVMGKRRGRREDGRTFVRGLRGGA